jgi:hypothetical protein
MGAFGGFGGFGGGGGCAKPIMGSRLSPAIAAMVFVFIGLVWLGILFSHEHALALFGWIRIKSRRNRMFMATDRKRG